MNQQTFTYTSKFGSEKTFFIGQKVECGYYFEYPRHLEPDVYKRGWLESLIDPPFSPVKIGVIVGDAGVHPFWLGVKDRKEQYLFVKFKEYFFAKPIPISCIYSIGDNGEL